MAVWKVTASRSARWRGKARCPITAFLGSAIGWGITCCRSRRYRREAPSSFATYAIRAPSSDTARSSPSHLMSAARGVCLPDASRTYSWLKSLQRSVIRYTPLASPVQLAAMTLALPSLGVSCVSFPERISKENRSASWMLRSRRMSSRAPSRENSTGAQVPSASVTRRAFLGEALSTR